MREFYEQEWLPQALAIGMTEDIFWKSNPRKIKAYTKAYKIKMQMQDEVIWLSCGNYIYSAVSVAVEHCLAGKKAKSEYIKDPVLKNILDKENLTEDEIANIEIQKAVIAEDLWIKNLKGKGLPETVI